MHSGLPYEPDDPRYEAVNIKGLVMPRLRLFREAQPPNLMAGLPGMPAALQRGPANTLLAEVESVYPDVEGQLQSIKSTLDQLAEARTIQKTAPGSKDQRRAFTPFDPATAAAERDKKATPSDKAGDQTKPAKDTAIPEHGLVRLIDVTLEPGKLYRYRLKIQMANPNYDHPDAATLPARLAKSLRSAEWFELPQTLSVPAELFYYVVDQKQITKDKASPGSPLSDMWMEPTDRYRKVAFQLQRWVESTPLVPGGEPVPIGDWVVADRVFVARGEYIGQSVRVDLPVWKYTQDSFVLPIRDRRSGGPGKRPGGVYVHFGPDNPDSETILVDFTGGRCDLKVSDPGPEGRPKTVTITDTSAVEVLLLSGEGKLLARNSVADSANAERERRRTRYHARIQEIKDRAVPGVGLGAGNPFSK